PRRKGGTRLGRRGLPRPRPQPPERGALRQASSRLRTPHSGRATSDSARRIPGTRTRSSISSRRLSYRRSEDQEESILVAETWSACANEQEPHDSQTHKISPVLLFS